MRKKHPEHVNLERWLVSYADFITLLFAFFVILYAQSKTDAKKFKTVADSIRAAFGGPIDLGGASGGPTMNPFEQVEPPGGRLMSLPAGKTNTASDPDPQLQEVKELLEETISLELGVTDLSEKVQMQYDSRGLIVRLSAKDFYDNGEVEIRPDLRPVLDRIARVIKSSKRLVRIEGHADVAEASLTTYPSDWELSAARASWVVRYWVKKFDMDPSRLGAAGYGHYRPIAKVPPVPAAGTKEAHVIKAAAVKADYARGSNRRVEIIILNNLYESP